ncbi:MAG: hypothetical protein JWQ63_4454 [Mucilaginibacter sp.]|nr:hypothetical protein [Mucilaginibacter sp.]
MATQKPWAILLCKFQNDLPEPPINGPVVPFRTICENFFTNPNAGFNAVKFFSDMSHGSIDISGSKVFGWYTLNVNITSYNAAGDPILDKTQDQIIAMAKQAASDAGVPISDSFTGAVVIMNIATGWAQGGPSSGIKPYGCMAADWRRVDARNLDGSKGVPGIRGGNGTEIFGQEMGHGFGLHHSRSDGILIGPVDKSPDYTDKYDIMSTSAWTYAAPDNDYGARGPGMNAWNMRGRGWLDETRVWHCPNVAFNQAIQLRPLHRIDLPGNLAVELPPINDTGGFPKYLVEFRNKEAWDSGIPKACILIHHFEVDGGGPLGGFMDSHSYIARGTNGNYELVEGDVFSPGAGMGPFPKLTVIKIDEVNLTADIELNYLPQLPNLIEIVIGVNKDKRLEAFVLAKDGSVYHKWQGIPNGSFNQWEGLAGHDIRQIAVAANQDGRLEIFALGGDNAVYHIWQTAPNGTWGQWAGLAGHDIQQITVAQNQDGRLEVFALGGDKAVYHIWQAVPNGGFGQWAGLAGHDIQQITVAQNQDGRLEVFALGADKAVYHIWQAVPNGNFGQWAGLAGHDIQQITVAQNQDGRLEVFALGGDGAAYHRWQVAPNGDWDQWFGL